MNDVVIDLRRSAGRRSRLEDADPVQATEPPDAAVLLAKFGNALGRSLLDKLHRGVVVTDSSRRVLYANRAATAMAMRGDGFSLANGRLLLLHKKAHKTLETLIAQAPADQEPARTFGLTLKRSNDLPPYRLLAMPLAGTGTAIACPYRLFGMFVYEPHAARFIPIRVLTELYGLSRAEARLAARLFQGRSLEQCAQGLGIALSTARTHLKHIFAKCGVQSQGELLQLLALGPRTL